MNASPPRGPGLAVRLAIAFAAVAIATAAAVAIAAPPIVGRGFAMMQTGESFTPGMGRGGGMGMGPGASGVGSYLAQAQQEATTTIVIVAVVAAAIASLIGIVIAWWIARPLVRLEHAASRVAAGDLAARSGIAQRSDEMGSLGRSFDAMAEDLEQSAAARRRFFADAAHEMKTPLAVIEATVAAVLDGVYDHDDRHLLTIKDQARLLGRVVDDLRTVSLAETGALPLVPVQLRPAEVASAVVESFRVRAEAAGVALEVAADPAAAGMTVRADRDRLAQAIGAYLDNALRYAPAGSRVTVAVSSPSPGRVRVAVMDAGKGVPAGDLPHVFDRFYQADPARDRGQGTSGLGLAIVKALVEAQGGIVGAANRPEGGAAFWLELATVG